MEPATLADPAPRSAAGKVHPAPTPIEAKSSPAAGNIHPPREPLTFVETIGENVMIGGLIITGNDPSALVIRGLGPSLGSAGVPNPLADPFLELHDGNGTTILVNNNWRDIQESALQNTGLAPGNDEESAILTSLAPGNYTAIVKGFDGGTGNGLVEVYKLGP